MRNSRTAAKKPVKMRRKAPRNVNVNVTVDDPAKAIIAMEGKLDGALNELRQSSEQRDVFDAQLGYAIQQYHTLLQKLAALRVLHSEIDWSAGGQLVQTDMQALLQGINGVADRKRQEIASKQEAGREQADA